MTAEPPSAEVSLHAGPWQLVYTAGELRYICWGQREVLRRVYVGVRDRLWSSVPGRLSDARVTQGEAGFEVTFRAQNTDANVDLAWQGAITGDAAGTITYRMRAVAQRGFWRNRIGICVLHPIAECADQPCRVTHVDGSVEESAFPEDIAPHQPFTDIRAIAHRVIPGVWAEIRFEGEVFETEDQRNWTDASFKTYSTPLSLPYPVWVEPGTIIEQSATLTLSERLPAQPAQSDQDEVLIVIGQEAPRPLPRLGLATSAGGPGLAPPAGERLRRLRLAHLRADLALDRPGWQADLQRVAADARLLGVPVEIALTLSADAPAELDRLAALRGTLPEVWAWLVFGRGHRATPPDLVQTARPKLQGLAPAALIGGGSDVYFAQLNRARPPAGLFDVLSYPITPQVHAEDNDTLVESLAGQAETVRTARRFAGGAAIAVSPVTLKPRTNPIALAAGAPETLPPADPRQGLLLAAGWTAISFKYLAESGADSVTYFETTGPRGVMAAESAAPTVFPVYHVLADIGEFAGGDVTRCVASHPLRADALLLTAGSRHRLLVASFADGAQTVTVQGILGSYGAAAQALDKTNACHASRDPESYRSRDGRVCEALGGELRLLLLPLAVVRVDWDEVSI